MLLKSKTEERRIEEYQEKRLQSEIYRGQDERCNQCLECNLDSRKTAAVIEVQEQMVETRVRQALRGVCRVRELQIVLVKERNSTSLVIWLYSSCWQ